MYRSWGSNLIKSQNITSSTSLLIEINTYLLPFKYENDYTNNSLATTKNMLITVHLVVPKCFTLLAF